MTEKPRIPLVAPELMEPRLGTLNVARTVAQNPALLKAWGEFAQYILGPKLSLTPRQRELAILRVGWNQRADYEWAHHVEIAKGIGMTDQDILAVQKTPGSCQLNDLECHILQAVDDIHSAMEISGGLQPRNQAFFLCVTVLALQTVVSIHILIGKLNQP